MYFCNNSVQDEMNIIITRESFCTMMLASFIQMTVLIASRIVKVSVTRKRQSHYAIRNNYRIFLLLSLQT